MGSLKCDGGKTLSIIFICHFCGNINKDFKNSDEIIEREAKCVCGKEILMEHSYPLLQAQDLILTAKYLYNMCKDIDKENRIKMQGYLKSEKVDITDEDLIKYITLYESIRSSYVDNKRDFFNDIDDEFEKKVRSKYNTDFDIIDAFIACTRVFLRNKFRKTFIIVIASSIEMLFNDYFKDLISKKLGNEGGKFFLSRYDYSGIQECIDICSAFVEKPVKEMMDNVSQGFYDRWSTLRKERNSIVHDNTKYVSRERTNAVYKLIEESVQVFSNLKSKLYV
jgi:hypothetical protein